LKPSTKKRNGGSVPRAAAIANPAKDVDTLRDLSKWLKSQWLRSYTLHMALGGEADRVAMVMLAACVKIVKEAQSWQR
jgi:hypothetical protein